MTHGRTVILCRNYMKRDILYGRIDQYGKASLLKIESSYFEQLYFKTDDLIVLSKVSDYKSKSFLHLRLVYALVKVRCYYYFGENYLWNDFTGFLRGL